MVGVLNIDKPQGITSHDVVQRVRRLGGLRRVGHAGTLDPLATGVLVICLGRATRMVEYIMGRPKRYITTIRLGQTTDSYDAEGKITAEAPVTVDQATIEAALAPFRGAIKQIPPMFSALKRNGQPLYKLARQGIEVERPPRDVTIYELKLTAWQAPYVELEIACSTGTYIRSLAHDLGQVLGCGGHITALRRTEVGKFSAETAHKLSDLTPENIEQALQSPESAITHLPRLDLSAAQSKAVLFGQKITRETHIGDEIIRAYQPDGQFIGILRAADTLWAPHKVFHPPSLEENGAGT